MIASAIDPQTRWNPPGETAGAISPAQEPLDRRAPESLLGRHGAAATIACPMRAADALMEILKAEGVEHIFGIPGGANLPTYDALVDADLATSRSATSRAAATPPRATPRRPAGSASPSPPPGPGATNLVTAIADAMMDSVPTVFVTGQVRTELIGTDGFQEADILGATLPFVKHSFQVTDPRQIPEYVHEAFHVASTGRPGPVLVDVPQDLSRADIEYEPRTDPVELPGYKPSTEGNIKQIRIAAKALANARRPILYTGGGVVNANASEELRELAGSDRFPVTSTLMGLGAFPASHEQLARDARHARHPHRQLRDGQRRPDRRDRRPLRRPHHRQALASSRRTPSSSTSTSTRPRSPRTSPPTSRSSATPSRCCRS